MLGIGRNRFHGYSGINCQNGFAFAL
jgi:hypothetical protein